MLFSQLDTIGDMIDDDLCALFVAEALVWIDAGLVLKAYACRLQQRVPLIDKEIPIRY